MIPKSAIIEWQTKVPWSNLAQVEQDLIICRALTAIYKDPFLSEELAFRGGTALNKLYLLPQPRYSEDIDLVQIKPAPIKPIIVAIQKVLSYLGKCSVEQKRNNNTLKFRIDSEIPPIQKIRLKIEINCREHFSVLPLEKVLFSVENQWFSDSAELITYNLNELVGTKLRALYQRRKGRDLFDLYRALKSGLINPDVSIECYKRYISTPPNVIPTQKEFFKNLEDKMKEEDFLTDTTLLLRPEEDFSPEEAFELVCDTFIRKL